uniref:MATH domain-containing protein n=1 Tax=Aegilops tauschii subsp. strangulata TaxID=200361 RepID=A0A453QWT9_AEGTS
MGNSGSTAPASLGKTHVPHFKWKVHDFSALLETKATSAFSAAFDCSGYKWYLQVTPKHKQDDKGNPYVALSLKIAHRCLELGHIVHAVFELSIFNHSKGKYCGCKASYNFDFKNAYSEQHCLIPLQELLKSSAFLVDDSCVFGVKILKIDVSSPEKKVVVVQKKATTLQNLFVQKKGFIKGAYTWTMNNFLELDLKHFVRSPTFEVGGHKWYIGMYPHGDKYSTDCLSLYLFLDTSDELPSESGKVVEMTLSILDQKNGKHWTRTSGSTLLIQAASVCNLMITVDLTFMVIAGLWVCGHSWGWPNFIGLKKLKDP